LSLGLGENHAARDKAEQGRAYKGEERGHGFPPILPLKPALRFSKAADTLAVVN
jgi:hypothetical protein